MAAGHKGIGYFLQPASVGFGYHGSLKEAWFLSRDQVGMNIVSFFCAFVFTTILMQDNKSMIDVPWLQSKNCKGLMAGYSFDLQLACEGTANWR